MSLITFNGMLQYDETLFDDINLPQGLDKDVLIDEINQRSGDLLCYYDEPTRFKTNITHWFNVVYYNNIVKMLEALNADYNPIHNYYREEDWTDGGWNHGKNVVDGTIGTDTTTTNDVSAYDSSTYSPATKIIVDDSVENDTTTTVDSSFSHTHGGTVAGNIGVTTNQKMINDEMAMRIKYNIYDVICTEFEKKFLVQVY